MVFAPRWLFQDGFGGLEFSMRSYFFYGSETEHAASVRTRLSALGWSEATHADASKVVVVAPTPEQLESLVVTMDTVRSLYRHGILLVVSGAASPELWARASTLSPQTASLFASDEELNGRFDGANEARQRFELAFAGERRLDLLRQSLEEVSMIDMRTGMYNRRFLVTRLREALAAARRYHRQLSLCVFRLQGLPHEDAREDDDEFASFAESLSDRLESTKRSADVHAWIADDEFALLLPETPSEGAEIVTQRVEEIIARLAQERALEVSVASAVALPTATDAGAEEFIERARKLLER